MLERDFQAQIIRAAELLGWAVYHVTNVRGRLRAKTSVGFPDLVLVRGRTVLFRELKTDRGKATPAQKAWLQALSEAGQDAAIWRPFQWTEIMEIIK